MPVYVNRTLNMKKIKAIGFDMDYTLVRYKSEAFEKFVHGLVLQKLVELKKEVLEKLKGKIMGTEVALSIASGNGKEHMAIISAILSLPAGIRFTALTKDGIVYL